MPGNPLDDSKPLAASKLLPGPDDLRHYPAYHLVAWQPKGVLDGHLLDAIGEWVCHIEKAADPFNRFIDLSLLTNMAVRTNHVFDFARRRATQYAGTAPVKTAIFSEDWVGFGIARMYESLMEGTAIDARAFRDRVQAALHLEVPVEVLKLEDKPAAPH